MLEVIQDRSISNCLSDASDRDEDLGESHRGLVRWLGFRGLGRLYEVPG